MCTKIPISDFGICSWLGQGGKYIHRLHPCEHIPWRFLAWPFYNLSGKSVHHVHELTFSISEIPGHDIKTFDRKKQAVISRWWSNRLMYVEHEPWVIMTSRHDVMLDWLATMVACYLSLRCEDRLAFNLDLGHSAVIRGHEPCSWARCRKQGAREITSRHAINPELESNPRFEQLFGYIHWTITDVS